MEHNPDADPKPELEPRIPTENRPKETKLVHAGRPFGMRSFGRIILAAAVISLILIIIYNSSDKVPLPTQEPNGTEAISPLQKTDQTILREEAKTSIEIVYPQFAGVPAVINSDLKSFVEGEVAAIEDMKLDQIPTLADVSYFLRINYEIEQANTNFVSLVFTVATYTGGAHGNQYFKTFNYNVDSGTAMTLEDLYPNEKAPLQKLRPRIETAVYDAISDTFRNNGEDSINPEDMLFEKFEDYPDSVFENFAFGSNYVKFFFSPYDIAPFAVGPIVARIER